MLTLTSSRTCKAILTKVFTDDPPTVQSTEVKAAHITELRNAVRAIDSST